jgi:hypothetical protein
MPHWQGRGARLLYLHEAHCRRKDSERKKIFAHAMGRFPLRMEGFRIDARCHCCDMKGKYIPLQCDTELVMKNKEESRLKS